MMATKKQITFDRDASQALKGIAICLMLLHHCFRQVKVFKEYAISCYPFSQELVVKVADMGKICVSLYAFISGYGLYLNYKKNRNKVTDTKWFLVRYIKTFSGYFIRDANRFLRVSEVIPRTNIERYMVVYECCIRIPSSYTIHCKERRPYYFDFTRRCGIYKINYRGEWRRSLHGKELSMGILSTIYIGDDLCKV